jgi:23S rRNA (adenine-N6)-dimethyltransferase
VLDIGAGTGALTGPLVHAGARVIAVELHPGRAQQLRERFSGQPVTVVQTDAADLRLPRKPFRVVANPPFAITTALIKRLLAPGSRLVAADLVVPRHVALRWLGEQAPGVKRWGQDIVPSVAGKLPRSAFRPGSTGETVVLRLVSRSAGRVHR